MRIRLLAFLLLPALAFCSEQWTEVKSPHFTVVTDAGEKRGKEVALHFEQLRQVFGSLLLHRDVTSSRPVQILAFRNTKQFRDVSPHYKGKVVELAGLYQKAQWQDFIAVDLSSGGDYRWHTVYHEYTHLLLNSNTADWPAWFDEGFAELFSTVDLSGKQAVIGRAPEYSAQIVVSNRLIPVAQLFSVRHDSATYNESGDRRSMFYAESWLLVHYLEDKRLMTNLVQFFAQTHGHADEAAFRSAMGMGFADLDRALQDYIRGNRISAWDTPLPTGIDANTFEVRPLTPNDALISIAEMHSAEIDHEGEAAGELERALAADPDNVRAHADLGYVYLRKHDYEHAEPHLEKAAASGSKDAMVHCYYAMLQQQKFQSGQPSPEQLDRQKKELEQAIALNPSLAEAYNLLAINAHERNDTNGAVQAALQAVARDPRNQLYAVNLANAYIANSKYSEAQSVVDRLRASEDPQVLAAILPLQSFLSQVRDAPASGDRAEAITVSLSDTTPGEPEPAAPHLAHKTLSPHSVDGTLMQVACNPDGSGKMLIADGDHLVELRFRSFPELAKQQPGKLTCATKNAHAIVEYAVDGTVKTISLP